MNLHEKIIAKNTRVAAWFLGFISFALFVYVLMALKDILIPVTFAIFLTFLFSPILEYFGKYKIPKWVTLISIVVILSLISYLLALIVISNFETFSQKLQVYSANLMQFLTQVLSPFNLTLRELAEMLDIKMQDFEIGNIFQRLFEYGFVGEIFTSITSMLGDLFIAMIFLVFMLYGKSKFEERLKIAFSENREIVSSSIKNIDEQLQSYIFIKTILSLATGLITTIILWIFGIDFAIIWGLLTFVLNYIPNIGSLIATIAPILIAMLEYGLGFKTITLSVLLLTNQNIIGNILEPHYMGRQMDLSPVFVLFSLIFWGWIWGIPGMFLAVPIAASMKILFSNIEPLKPIAILMGSKATAAGPKTRV